VLAASLVVALVLDRWWVAMPVHHFAGAQILAIAAGLALLWAVPALRLAFVPPRHRFRRAHENALKQFMARNIHVTSARTGVLLFVSLAERYAEVVADSGINARVDQETWNATVAGLVDHARRDRLADGFIAAIATVGAILTEHFPVAEIERNELDDHLVEI
jgi:putative membrane protein